MDGEESNHKKKGGNINSTNNRSSNRGESKTEKYSTGNREQKPLNRTQIKLHYIAKYLCFDKL